MCDIDDACGGIGGKDGSFDGANKIIFRAEVRKQGYRSNLADAETETRRAVFLLPTRRVAASPRFFFTGNLSLNACFG